MREVIPPRALKSAVNVSRRGVKTATKSSAMRFVTSPVTGLVRKVAPRFIADRHIAALAFVLLFWIWVALLIAKLRLQMPVG